MMQLCDQIIYGNLKTFQNRCKSKSKHKAQEEIAQEQMSTFGRFTETVDTGERRRRRNKSNHKVQEEMIQPERRFNWSKQD